MSKYDDTREKQIRCSFCGRTQEQVTMLIQGPDAFICDECVDLCNEILEEEFFENKDKTEEDAAVMRSKEEFAMDLFKKM